jgi:hypothetical protein
MDMKRIANMADKLAAEETNEPLVAIDQAIDNIIAASEVIAESLALVKAVTPEQMESIKQIKDILETAIDPYTSDIVELLEAFEEKE